MNLSYIFVNDVNPQNLSSFISKLNCQFEDIINYFSNNLGLIKTIQGRYLKKRIHLSFVIDADLKTLLLEYFLRLMWAKTNILLFIFNHLYLFLLYHLFYLFSINLFFLLSIIIFYFLIFNLIFPIFQFINPRIIFHYLKNFIWYLFLRFI
jgi:hypothetical protein